MQNIEVTSMSSKGQIVIPKSIRSELAISEGTKFIVIAESGNLLLKKINEPNKHEFASLLKRSREIAKIKKLTPKDLAKTIKSVRAKRAR